MKKFKETLSIEKKLSSFEGEGINFVETILVKKGVICDVYEFNSDNEKDLGVVTVKAGYKTPLQKVLKGDKTIESFVSGRGILIITMDNKIIKHMYPGGPKNVIVEIGQLMQWEAISDLVFSETCYPPYADGRFENIDEN